MPMTAAQEMLEELLTLGHEEGAIQKFHSLSKEEATKSQPWRLQVGLRNDRLHKLLTASCHLSLWQIASVQMKSHSLKASPLVHFSFDDWGVLQKGLKAMMQCGTDPFLILEMKQFQTLPNLQLFSCPRWTQPLFTASGKEGLLERLVR